MTTIKKVTIKDKNNNNNNFNSSIPSISETSSNISENYKYDNFNNKNKNKNDKELSNIDISDNENESISSLTFSSLQNDESYIESNEIINNYKIDLNNLNNLNKINNKLSFKTPINNNSSNNNLKLSNIQEKINKINLNIDSNKDNGKSYIPLSHSTPFISNKIQPQPQPQPLQPPQVHSIQENSSTISSIDEKDKLIKELQDKISFLQIKNNKLELEINKLKENENENSNNDNTDNEMLNYKSFKLNDISKYNQLKLNKIDSISILNLKNYLKLIIFKFNKPLNKFFKFIYYNFKNLIGYESFFNNIHKLIYKIPINKSFKISHQLQDDDDDDDDDEGEDEREWLQYKDLKCEENFKNLQKCLYKTNEILNSKNI
ncbi:hypothetical protein B5S32_g2511 [[Candida] boidinii]|nr:hypothetical protein B5S32_g2511 [[Candida] boidinii]